MRSWKYVKIKIHLNFLKQSCFLKSEVSQQLFIVYRYSSTTEDDVQFRLCRLENWKGVSSKYCNNDISGYIVVIHLFFPVTEKVHYHCNKRVSGTFLVLESVFMM